MKANATRILAVVLATALVGCSAGHEQPRSIAASRYPGLPAGVTPSAEPYRVPGDGDPIGRWRDGVLELTVFGSGSCPPTPVRLTAAPPDAVEVSFSADYDGVCTADLSPTTWVLDLPSSVGETGTLTVRIRGDGVRRTDLRLQRVTPTPTPTLRPGHGLPEPAGSPRPSRTFG
jgi:hypothetical protein